MCMLDAGRFPPASWDRSMADVFSKAKRSEIMSRVRNRRTAPENQVAGLLREIGVRYRRNVGSLPGEPDFAVHAAHAAIFVHGCFWHGHTNCKRAKLPATNRRFWREKIDTNKRRDRRVARLLRKQGWQVLTIWQCRLRNPQRVCAGLRRTVQSA